ncbi:Putative enoyl-CoA hydratase [Agrobacterium fabacearum CFBP 5771]|jgi:enoyl-CoA hydratase|uniref:Enoyl-CoA hydratase n=2 Tax=Agrobacterium tumefaciens complex TaxID=1183400 RepID=A0A4D7Z8B0_AGRTU|nr:enoyl-CoA hydratase-related protein [Agrobacterium tumefaciens]QCL98210.1 enoyl-CoA hydratase [Agrobacterium tumefaciens]CVI24775.1 Putative enoyl-CoA hydratase [Agrobacterium fabacearum CFBP 5771]
MYEAIETSREDGVAIVRLNRPKQLNALNATLAKEIISAVEDLERDRAIGAIVLTGSERAFAAGADIAELSQKTAAEMIEADYFAEWERFTRCRTPKIAAVRGFALGGGCELVMMCDFAIAGTSARFGQPEVRIGVIAGMGGTQRMTRLIGRARSMDMHLTGRMMDAAEALQAGLVARVVPDDEVLAVAMEAAKTIASHSRTAVRDARDAVMRAEELPLTEGLKFERVLFHRLFGSADQREGMSAFLEKRAPRFGPSDIGENGLAGN